MNELLEHYILDVYGVRYLCDEHWGWAIRFFRLIKKCRKCKRAHCADLYPSQRTMYHLKFQGKFWELCDDHYEYFDKKICSFFGGIDLSILDDIED